MWSRAPGFQRRRFWADTPGDMERCSRRLGRIDSDSMLRRAMWTFVARLERGPRLLFTWFPINDPANSHAGGTRFGRLLFKDGDEKGYFLNSNGEPTRTIKCIRIVKARAVTDCPVDGCLGFMAGSNCTNCGHRML